MIRYIIRSIVLFAWLFAVACNTGMDVQAERQALLEADRAWAAAAAAGDMDEVLSNWSDDAVIYPSGMPAVRGKETIREFVAANRVQAGFSITWEPLEVVVSRDGGLGYTVGNYEVSINGPDGEPMLRKGRYVETWRKDSAHLTAAGKRGIHTCPAAPARKALQRVFYQHEIRP